MGIRAGMTSTPLQGPLRNTRAEVVDEEVVIGGAMDELIVQH